MHELWVDNPSPCLLRLDAQPWAEFWVGESHGLRVGLRATHGASLTPLVQALQPMLRPGAGSRVDGLFSLMVGDVQPQRGRVRRLHLAYVGHALLARGGNLQEVLAEVEAGVHRYIAEHAPQHVFVHAGAVEWQGRALLFPGKSHSGKTTLIAALLRAGARYLSDEYAVLDAQGRVHAYPKPLLLRGSEVRTPCAPESLGEVARGGPFALGGIVHTHFAAGRSFKPRALSPGAAGLALLANCVAVRTQPALTVQALAQAVHRVPAARSARGDAPQAAAQILAWSAQA